MRTRFLGHMCSTLAGMTPNSPENGLVDHHCAEFDKGTDGVGQSAGECTLLPQPGACEPRDDGATHGHIGQRSQGQTQVRLKPQNAKP